MARRRLIIIGAGGFAKSVVDSYDRARYQLVGFIDERPSLTEHLGYPVLAHTLDDLSDVDGYAYFIAIGHNGNRRRWFDELDQKRLRIITVIDPSAIVSPRAELGRGCFVGKLAVVNATAVIGDDCIINTRALVEHGCCVSNHVNISTNAVINGDVTVGEGSFIGSSSVTNGQIAIGSWSTVGAGAVVIHDVGNGVTVAGVPARVLHEGAMLG